MLRSLTVLLAVVVFCLSFLAQENKGKSLELKDLPAVVQKTVEDNVKGGQIKKSAKKKEMGSSSMKSKAW